ncbi:MAG: valine--tRNA ligase [Alphaproteobacteria bacterium]|nr:valine--tRNA ligase [Alphaproteobacteria bacterium]
MLDKTYDPKAVEARFARLWEESGDFNADPAAPGQPFCIMIPPPNVTGSLHMGHALNNTLQDVLVRWRRMQGRNALWQVGTDHAGIATQMVVERRLAEQGIGLDRAGKGGEGAEAAAAPAPAGKGGKGANLRRIGREEFLRHVWEWKAESGGTITRQLRRLGASVDWRRERFTMDEGLSAAVLEVFVTLYKQGLIYRDKRLVNWDPKLHTAISDLEVESREIKGHLWHIRYPVEGMADRFITVATTRPETMLGDTAIAVHPDDDRYRDLIGRHAILPLVGRRIPIVADSYSDPEKGTGAVKITPAHDFNDFQVGQRHKLEMVNILDRDARLNETAPEAYRGLDRFVARERIVADLAAQDVLERVEPHAHMVPHGDRSGVVIEPWLTDQWYVDAHTLAQPAIRAVEDGRTVFVPKTWENTYFEWLRNIQPWCISRQLWWGHQIPAWYGPDGQVFVEKTEAEAAAAARALYGKDVALSRDPDVLDTWFSSALWPFSTLGWPDKTAHLARYYPGDVLVTGFDIIFFWVARMMMMGLHFMGEVPFRTVYVHALVRDERGQKMSKSKGNVIDPLDLIDRYGTDALRFTLIALSAQGRDVKLAESRVEGYRNFTTKLWNAARFCEMNECRPVPGWKPEGLSLPLNRWIVGALAEAAEALNAALEAYRFNDAAGALYQFVWGSFCDWHLELAKPILAGGSDAEKAETRATTAFVLDQLLHLLHPLMPFVTEDLWEKLADRGGQRLIRRAWPDPAALPRDAEAAAEIGWVIRLVSEVRSIRAEMNVPASAQVAILLKDAAPATLARLARWRDIIFRLARLASAEALAGEAPRGAAQAVLDEATLILPLAGVIDLAKERARLEKEIARLAKDIEAIERKLGNEAFRAKAPPEVVEEQEERRATAREATAKLGAALARLAE